MSENNNKERKFGRKVMWLINLGLITVAFYAILFSPHDLIQTARVWIIYAFLSSVGTLIVDGLITVTDAKSLIPFVQNINK